MSCGNNCANCSCDTDEAKTLSFIHSVRTMEEALEQIVLACTEEHWSKHDIKRIALAGLGRK